MLRVENVATPATAATVAVPDKVPSPGLVPSAAVTLPLNPVAVLPSASRAVTCTAGAIVRSEEHTSELQSHSDLVCRLLLEKKKAIYNPDRSLVYLQRSKRSNDRLL